MLKMYSQREIELAIEFGKRGHSLKEFKKFINSKKEKESKPYYLFNTICNYYNVDPEAVKGRSRDKNLVYVRKIFSYFACVKYNFRQEDTAFILRKERSTVVHYRNSIIDWLDIQDKQTINDLNNLKQLLNNG